MFISCVFIFSLQRFKYTTGSSSTAFLCHGWLHNKEWQEARCSGGCCGVGDTAGCRGRHKCRHHKQGGHQEERQEGAAGHGPRVSIHLNNLYWGFQFRMFRTNSSWKRTTRWLPVNAAGLICRSNRKATATSWGLSAWKSNGGNIQTSEGTHPIWWRENKICNHQKQSLPVHTETLKTLTHSAYAAQDKSKISNLNNNASADSAKVLDKARLCQPPLLFAVHFRLTLSARNWTLKSRICSWFADQRQKMSFTSRLPNIHLQIFTSCQGRWNCPPPATRLPTLQRPAGKASWVASCSPAGIWYDAPSVASK